MSKLEDKDKSEWLQYYQVVRERISTFDELSARVTLEGTTFSVALLGLSGVVLQQPFAPIQQNMPLNKTLLTIAMAIGVASIVATVGFTLLAIFYAKLLGSTVQLARSLEDNKLIDDEKLRLSKVIDETSVFGLKPAGKNTWIVHSLVFAIIIVIQIAVSVSYYVLLVTQDSPVK